MSFAIFLQYNGPQENSICCSFVQAKGKTYIQCLKAPATFCDVLPKVIHSVHTKRVSLLSTHIIQAFFFTCPLHMFLCICNPSDHPKALCF